MDEVVEALEKYQGLVPLVYDIETMSLDEARPEDMRTAVYLKREADKVIAELEESHKMEVEQLLIEIAELKDKCLMHDFFWEGCGFAKRGFKNTIAVSEAFDTLEAENESLLQQNRELCQALQVMYSKEEYDKQKYKRCLAMAKWCNERHTFNETNEKRTWLHKWHNRWLELAEKFKTNSTAQQGNG